MPMVKLKFQLLVVANATFLLRLEEGTYLPVNAMAESPRKPVDNVVEHNESVLPISSYISCYFGFGDCAVDSQFYRPLFARFFTFGIIHGSNMYVAINRLQG